MTGSGVIGGALGRAFAVTDRQITGEPDAQRPAWTLDDDADRHELRDRYSVLLQELRVVLPGVQVLAAFLLTVPFAQRFSGLDATEKALFAVSLVSASMSVIAFVTPVCLHRFGRRTERAVRLEVSIIATRIGFVLLLLALIASLEVVCRFLFDDAVAVVLVVATFGGGLGIWFVLPMVVRRKRRVRFGTGSRVGGHASGA